MRHIYCTIVSHQERLMQLFLFGIGVALLTSGITFETLAQVDLSTEYAEVNTVRIEAAKDILLEYLEGSFGALIMVCAGVGAILSSAFGQYRAALSCLIVAVGSFILRSVLETFFINVENQ